MQTQVRKKSFLVLTFFFKEKEKDEETWISLLGGGLFAQAGLGHNRPAARAGLGGILDGSGNSNNPNAAGNLFAEAGLGNNLPGARAGLGGILDGSGNSNNPVAGNLFAEAGLGNNQPAARAGLEGVLNGNENKPISDNVHYDTVSSNTASIKPSTSHTNIQLISGSIPKNHKNQRAVNIFFLSLSINFNSSKRNVTKVQILFLDSFKIVSLGQRTCSRIKIRKYSINLKYL